MQDIFLRIRESVDSIGASVSPMGLVWGQALHISPGKRSDEQMAVLQFKEMMNSPLQSRFVKELYSLPVTSVVLPADVLEGIRLYYISGPKVGERRTVAFVLLKVDLAKVRGVVQQMSRAEKKVIRPKLAEVSFDPHSIHNSQICLGSVVRELTSLARSSESENFSQTLLRYEDFVSSFSHEALSPLQQVSTTLDLMLRNSRLSDVDRDCIESAIVSLDSMRVSLEGVRLLFRSEKKKALSNQFRSVDVRQIVDNWCRAYADKFEDKGIEVIVEPKEPWLLRCIPEYMEILIKNLVSNGEKYSFDASGRSTSGRFIVRYDQNAFVLKFVNFGVPIPVDDISEHRIFEDGYRASTANDRGRIGKGIGLYLVRKVASIHQATVSVQSDIQNPGSVHPFARTEFSVRFPVGLRGGL